MEKSQVMLSEEILTQKAEEKISVKVEDKANKNILKVLSKRASLSPVMWECKEGELEYVGKINLTMVYMDEDRLLRSSFYEGKFKGKIENDAISFSSKCNLKLALKDLQIKKVVGSEVLFEVTCEAQGVLCSSHEVSLVKSIPDAYFEEETFENFKLLEKNHTFTIKDEMDITSSVKSILDYTGEIEIANLSIRNGVVTLDGKLVVGLTYENEEIDALTFSVDFSEEIDFLDADPTSEIFLSQNLEWLKMEVVSNETKNQSKLKIEFCCVATLKNYPKETVKFGKNFFSKSRKLLETVESVKTTKIHQSLRLAKKVLSSFPKEDNFLCTSYFGGFGYLKDIKFVGDNISGKAVVTVYGKGDEELKAKEVEFPFEFDVNLKGKENCDYELDFVLSEIKVQPESTKINLELSLKGVINEYASTLFPCVTNIAEGEEKSQIRCAFTVYLGEEGETMMKVCENLNILPHELLTQNPGLEFPLTEDTKIVIYSRQVI